MATTEGNYLSDIVVHEMELRHSRELVTVITGQDLSKGAVVGKITKSIPTTGTAGSNTGGGTMTDVVGGADTKIGTYKLTCTAEATDGGTFQVVDPDGYMLEPATVGVEYSNDHLGFTINDVGTDFDAGDTFTVTVAAGSGKITEIDFDAVDGSQDAYGILIDNYDATDADVSGVAIVRQAEVIADNLVWPTGATENQKTAALAVLEKVGILQRTEA